MKFCYLSLSLWYFILATLANYHSFILFLANESYENSAKTHEVYKVSERRKRETDELPRVLRKFFFFVSYQS